MRHPDFDPSEHPRGPNGRFTESFTRELAPAEKSAATRTVERHSPRKDLTTPDAARTYLSALSGDKPDPAAGTYLSGGHREVNAGLRAGNADSPGVAALDGAMKPLPHGVTVWRHIPSGMFAGVDPKSLVGMKVRDAGFFPTTLAPPMRDADGVRMRVVVPPGTKAAPAPDAYGLVLDRGLDMAVTEVADAADGGLDMTVAVLPSGPAPSEPGPAEIPATEQAPTAEPAETPPPTEPEPTPEPTRPFADRLASATSGPDALLAAPVSNYTDRGPELSDDQADALDAYAGWADWQINSQLRGDGDDAQVTGWVDQIDSAMAMSQLQSDVAVWRGARDGSLLFGDRLGDDLTGMEWREDAYVSTSSEEQVATDFATGAAVRNREAPSPVLMHIMVPAGVSGVEMSDGRYESEMLLQRGLRLRVVADHGTRPDGVRMLDVEVIPVGT